MQTENSASINKAKVNNTNKKLFFFTVAMGGVIFVLAILLGNLLLESNSSLEYITQKVLPATVIAEKITATSVQLNGEVPDVLNARNQAELSTKYNNLLKFIDKQAIFLKDLNAIPHNNIHSRELLELIEKATAKLVIVNDYMSNILWTRDLENKFSSRLLEASNKFMLQITKLADDALFELVTNNRASEQPASQAKQVNQNIAANKGQFSKQLTLFNALLEVKSDGILIIGILETIINHMNIDEIIPFQERFESATIKLKEHLKILQDFDENKFKDLNLLTNELLTYGQGKDNCFSLRDAELRFTSKIAEVAKDLKPIGNRMEEVEKLLLIDTLKNIDKLSSFQNQQKKLVFALAAIFILFTCILVGCLYLMRKIAAKN